MELVELLNRRGKLLLEGVLAGGGCDCGRDKWDMAE